MKNILKAFSYILFYMIFQVIVMSLIAIVIANLKGNMNEVESFMNNNVLGLTILTNIFTILIILLFFKVRKKKLLHEINIKAVSINKYVLPCISAFCFSSVFALLTYNMNFENAIQIKSSVEYYSSILPYLGTVLQIIALLLVSPITEEVICRGLILTTLQKKYSNIIAVILSSLLFGVIHIMAGGILLVIGAIIMGSIFGIIYVKSKSLLPAIVAHIVANIPDFIIALLPRISPTMQYFLIIVFAIIFGLTIYKFITKENVEL